MEATAARERKDRFCDAAAGRFDRGERLLQIGRIEDGQRPSGGLVRIGLKAAFQALIEGGIGGAVIGKRPAERGSIKRLDAVQTASGGGHFEIVELAGLLHGDTPLCSCCVLYL